MTYNAANRKHVREAEKHQVVLSTINREVIAGLMSVMNGRHWIYDQLAEAKVFADPFSPDPSVHAYLAGRRAGGMALFNDIILYAPDNFTLMLKEAHERAAVIDTRNARDARSLDGVNPFDPGGFDPYADGAPEGPVATQ